MTMRSLTHRDYVILAALALPACGVAGGGGGTGGFFSELPLGVAAALPVPPENPLGEAKVALGRRLFFETRLSRSGATSCATCHDPTLAFTDGRPIAVGEGGSLGRRNSPTLLNRAYGHSQFYDGRAATLEVQALLPLTNPVELGNTSGEILRRLSADDSYRRAFALAFGSRGITLERLAAALASFQRTLVSGDAPIDRLQIKADTSALAPEARRGLELFLGRARCVVCHEPPLFTDERFHNTGVAWTGGAYADSGRFGVTRRPEDLGAFKVPTLRNVALTAPYMHDGSLATLEEVVDFYDRGGRPNPHLDPAIRPLKLTAAERAELLALLCALTAMRRSPPAPDPSIPRRSGPPDTDRPPPGAACP